MKGGLSGNLSSLSRQSAASWGKIAVTTGLFMLAMAWSGALLMKLQSALVGALTASCAYA